MRTQRSPSQPVYQPNREQLALAEQLTSSLQDLLPISRLHRSAVETPEVWSTLEELGIFSITLSEERGGSGLGATEEVLISIGLGQQLISPSIIATMGAAHVLPIDAERSMAPLRVAAGYCHGARILKVADPQTRLILVREYNGASLVSDHGIDATKYEALWLSQLSDVPSPSDILATYNHEDLLQLRLLDAAVLAGMADAALQMSVAYAGTRQQFGRPIGSFQAIKHHCANMAIGARRARDQATFAAIALDSKRPDHSLQIECAYLTAAAAAVDNAGLNIQIHGGLGFSDEADPHLILKRVQLFIAIAGGLEAANERVSAAEAAL